MSHLLCLRVLLNTAAACCGGAHVQHVGLELMVGEVTPGHRVSVACWLPQFTFPRLPQVYIYPYIDHPEESMNSGWVERRLPRLGFGPSPPGFVTRDFNL